MGVRIMDNMESYIYVGTLKGKEDYRYRFVCPKCDNTYILATGRGRFGNLGHFMCTDCKELYYATIDEHRFPQLYVAKGSRPGSGEKEGRPFAVLKEIDDKC